MVIFYGSGVGVPKMVVVTTLGHGLVGLGSHGCAAGVGVGSHLASNSTFFTSNFPKFSGPHLSRWDATLLLKLIGGL